MIEGHILPSLRSDTLRLRSGQAPGHPAPGAATGLMVQLWTVTASAKHRVNATESVVD